MKHIIHTDNSEFFRKLMKTYLSEKGLESEGFSHGADALAAIKAGKANLIITGLELADMGGEDFIKMLTVSNYTLPIIIVTSKEDEFHQTRLKALNVKAVISKSGDWQKELDKVLI